MRVSEPVLTMGIILSMVYLYTLQREGTTIRNNFN